MDTKITNIPFGVPVIVPQVSTKETDEINDFDDVNYGCYRENSNFIMKEDLFQVIINDLLEYLQTIKTTEKIHVGYILYTKLQESSNKMNNILNLLIQKINPNIRIVSNWEILTSYKGPLQTINGIEHVDFDKIRIKLLIRPNDKDIAIKKLANMHLKILKKNNKKLGVYLSKQNI